SSLAAADRVWLYRPADLGWNLQCVADALEGRARVCESVAAIVDDVAGEARPGDRVLIMSNGGFENIHERLLAALRDRERV
ncbi:MAG TPA: UDP-N-acetylmuramate:L-alanyl-gamma-D-glutamyl-meso-diaminopimelate ligase, partial [Gammaproteobacteria bacterium]|nr:UDP-N-acetylmuramate:L-alanyl-gamma-D-glutamyl-meso-diaminopimelate ligase [Gammaproteobacteria bacterium]